jgi:hypothetical protein
MFVVCTLGPPPTTLTQFIMYKAVQPERFSNKGKIRRGRRGDEREIEGEEKSLLSLFT